MFLTTIKKKNNITTLKRPYTLFATPEDVRSEPFIFCRVTEFCKSRECVSLVLVTQSPMSDPLLQKFGTWGAEKRWMDWWRNWEADQFDREFLGLKFETVEGIYLEMKMLTGQISLEPDYAQVH